MKNKSLLLVSIIIPTYNRETKISRAINSVVNQTYKNWELIIIDDGSKDDTKNVIKPYLKDKRIKYFYQKNSGVASARNLGIKKSTGEYLAFLDSDDECLNNRIEKQLSEMLKYKAIFSLCNSIDLLGSKKRLIKNYKKSFYFDINIIISKEFFSSHLLFLSNLMLIMRRF